MVTCNLNELKAGESAYILNIDEHCYSKLRLLDLGFAADSVIMPVWQGNKRNITAYLIKGTLIALRNEDAGCINVFLK